MSHFTMNFNYREMVERKAFLAKSKHQYRVSQWDEHDWSAITKRTEINKSIQVCPISRWTLIIRKWWKEKLFLANQCINIVYPNEINMIGVSITKRMEIIKSIQVCPISRWTLIIRKWWKEKLFLPNQSINIVYPNEMNMIEVQ